MEKMNAILDTINHSRDKINNLLYSDRPLVLDDCLLIGDLIEVIKTKINEKRELDGLEPIKYNYHISSILATDKQERSGKKFNIATLNAMLENIDDIVFFKKRADTTNREPGTLVIVNKRLKLGRVLSKRLFTLNSLRGLKANVTKEGVKYA